MATRSRRSTGNETGGVQINNIHLYDLARLKKELETRGLSTVGKKHELADRLYDVVTGNTAAEVAPAVTTPKAKGRKSLVKTESPNEEEPQQIKEEVDDDIPEPKKTAKSTKARCRKHKEASVEEKEEEEHKPKEKKSPKKDVMKNEVVMKAEITDEEDEEKVKLRKKRKIKKEEKEDEGPSKISSPKKARKCFEVPAEPIPEPEEVVDLLSLLAPKPKVAVKKELPDEDEVSGNSQKPTHSHGTRRAKAMQSASVEAVMEQKKFIESLREGDVFDDDDTPDYVPPEAPKKWEEVPAEKAKRAKSEEGKQKKPLVEAKPAKEAPPLLPPKPSIKEQWAQRVAEMKKLAAEREAAEKAAAEQKAAAISASKPRQSGEMKPKPKPQAAPSTSTFILDDILSKQDQLALEAKKKQEEEEREAREAERRHKEKMAEFRRKQAEAEAKRAEKLKNLPPGALKPKPIVEPKIIKPELKPHPYAIPQPLPNLMKTDSIETKGKMETQTKPVQRAIPPPPPPKKDKPAHLQVPSKPLPKPDQRLPPPPPPKKTVGPLPPPPPPRKVEPSITSEGSIKDDEKASTRNEPILEKNETNILPEGVVDPDFVSKISEALVHVLKRGEATKIEPVEAAESLKGTTSSSVSVTPMSPENDTDKIRGEEPPIEEYDPLDHTDVDTESFTYIPSTVVSRNQTMTREDESEDEELSDEEVRGEMDDEEDSDESESENESKSKTTPVKSPSKIPITGREDVVASLLQNPRELLVKANAVVFSKTDCAESSDGPQYIQMPSADDYEPDEEERKTPEYHGEPVPSDDEVDFFELAAGIQKPKKKKEITVEEEKLPSDESIEPDYYNADLHIKGAVDKNWLIEPENADGLALMWGGVKSTYGIRLPFRDVRNQTNNDEKMETDEEHQEKENKETSKKIVFQIKIVEFLPTKHLPFEELDPHDVRVGFSLRSAPNILGEFPSSYCITSLGKKATNNYFSDFDNAFHLNDVITACIDLEEATISYWKNDDYLGIAFSDIELPDDDAIFPHICIKNCNVAVNFGEFQGEDEEHPWPKNDAWRFMTSLGRGDLERSTKSPESKAQCTILMMVGLPGVGKTTWVREYLRDHPEEYWTLINNETVLAAMKVNGISRKRAHQGRWDMIMGLIGKSMQRCILLAARRRKNYILDMTNTSRDTRKKRLQLFEEFRRKCVIIMPSDEEMLDRQARQARQEGTAMMPPEAMLEMKAVISLPSQEFEPFEDIYFIEPPVHRIQECIDQINRYNEEARPWFQKKYRRRRSQMIGLGEGMQRDPLMPKKPVQPLTVMPQLKVAVVPLDDSSNPGPLSGNSSHDSAPSSASALGFTVVEDRTPTRPAVPISIDYSIPPPSLIPSTKPLVRVTIEDIPATAVPVPFKRDNNFSHISIEEQMAGLDEDELKELQESVKTSNPSGNPMMNEAIMRARLIQLQIRKAEKVRQDSRGSLSSTPIGAAPPSSASGTPIQVLGGRTIPTIGPSKPITIDTAQVLASTSFSPASGTSSPRVPLTSPGVMLNLPPPTALSAPYLASQTQNGFSQPPPSIVPQFPGTPGQQQGFPQFSQPPPNFGNFQQPPPMNVPPPGIFPNNGVPPPSSIPYPWSQTNNGN